MLRILIIPLIIFFFNNSKAEENYFLSLKYNKVNVRYGPGLDYPIKFIYLKKISLLKLLMKKKILEKFWIIKTMVVGFIGLN